MKELNGEKNKNRELVDKVKEFESENYRLGKNWKR